MTEQRIVPGHLVKIWVEEWDRWDYGEVTLVRDDGYPKVLFIELNYDYYNPNELEIVGMLGKKQCH